MNLQKLPNKSIYFFYMLLVLSDTTFFFLAYDVIPLQISQQYGRLHQYAYAKLAMRAEQKKQMIKKALLSYPWTKY